MPTKPSILCRSKTAPHPSKGASTIVFSSPCYPSSHVWVSGSWWSDFEWKSWLGQSGYLAPASWTWQLDTGAEMMGQAVTRTWTGQAWWSWASWGCKWGTTQRQHRKPCARGECCPYAERSRDTMTHGHTPSQARVSLRANSQLSRGVIIRSRSRKTSTCTGPGELHCWIARWSENLWRPQEADRGLWTGSLGMGWRLCI